jgi:archaellum component FlaD/FlaE
MPAIQSPTVSVRALFSKKEDAMTRRALRIAAILLIIIQSLLFYPAPISRAQDYPSPTQDELILAQETADLFLKRLEETGDFSSVIDELYAEDFIERYLQQQILEGKESNSPSSLYFPPGFRCNRELLKRATVEDWRRFYIAANNFIYHITVAGLNKHADDYLNGREPDDERTGRCIPSKVVELLKSNPILSSYSDDESDKSADGETDDESQSGASREDSEPKIIETPEEMQDVAETLQEAARLLREDQGSPGLTEPAKSALEVMRLKLKEEGDMEISIEVADKKYLGLPPGTRVLNVLTPMLWWLEIALVNGKQKIVQAQFPMGD